VEQPNLERLTENIFVVICQVCLLFTQSLARVITITLRGTSAFLLVRVAVAIISSDSSPSTVGSSTHSQILAFLRIGLAALLVLLGSGVSGVRLSCCGNICPEVTPAQAAFKPAHLRFGTPAIPVSP